MELIEQPSSYGPDYLRLVIGESNGDNSYKDTRFVGVLCKDTDGWEFRPKQYACLSLEDMQLIIKYMQTREY